MASPKRAEGPNYPYGPEVRIKIGGEAGMGIKAAGQSLARAFANAGLHTFDVTEYPSLIRGGHNVYYLRVSEQPIFSQVKPVDILVALNQETVDKHLAEVVDGGAVLYDPGKVDWDSTPGHERVVGLDVPWEDIAKEVSGKKIMANTVALGAALGAACFPVEYLTDSLDTQFRRKSPEIAEQNMACARRGYEATSARCKDFPFTINPVKDAPRRMICDGNEAVGLGALAGGITFYAAYPMTPASPLLHFFAARDEKAGMVVKHTEDELAAMNMVVGAAFGGARAMCASAGGGFALMVEAFGLAGVSESAVVVGVFSRTAPGTGLPTWTEQADLRFVMHAAPSEFPRVIISPGDREDAYRLGWQAFNLADQLQTPVVILSEQYLQESRASVEPFDSSEVTIDRGKLIAEGDVNDHAEALHDGVYHRYEPSEDGVSWRALPGVRNANMIVNSYEHDHYGNAEETADNRSTQHDKRMRKLELARELVPAPQRYGPEQADLSIVCFGATKGPVREAMKWLEGEGVSVNLLQLVTCWPFPADEVNAFLDAARTSLVIEGNYAGQLEGLIRQQCLRDVDHSMRRYDGRPFFPEDIFDTVRELVPVREAVAR